MNTFKIDKKKYNLNTIIVTFIIDIIYNYLNIKRRKKYY